MRSTSAEGPGWRDRDKKSAWPAPWSRLIGAMLLSGTCAMPAAAKNCDNLKTNNPDPPIGITFSQQASLGTVAKPDPTGGSSLITLSPTGTRTIPPNLVINRDLGITGRQPQAATAVVSGGANCQVRITVTSTTGNLQGVTLRNTATNTDFTSGTRFDLNATGSFTFTIGVSELVTPSTSTIGGTISIQVSY